MYFARLYPTFVVRGKYRNLTQKRGYMRRSIGPILLIVVGAVLLLANLGLIQIGMLKEIVKQWWPALLIVIGVLQLSRR